MYWEITMNKIMSSEKNQMQLLRYIYLHLFGNFIVSLYVSI